MDRDIRLIALDLDGTLYTDEKKITPHTLEVLAHAAEQGVLVMPATGRTATGFPNVLKELPFVRYALTSNGAAVHDFIEDRPVYTDLLSVEHTLELLEFAEASDCMDDVYIDGVGYSEESKLAHADRYFADPHMVEYVRRTRKAVPSIPGLVRELGRPVEKVVMYYGDIALRDRNLGSLRADPKWEFSHICTALKNNIEITNRTADKGTSLIRFGEKMGIRRDQIMACGDGLNDLDMIREAGFGVAMANAVPEIKLAASYITKSNMEDGVAYAVERYVLK